MIECACKVFQMYEQGHPLNIHSFMVCISLKVARWRLLLRSQSCIYINSLLHELEEGGGGGMGVYSGRFGIFDLQPVVR